MNAALDVFNRSGHATGPVLKFILAKRLNAETGASISPFDVDALPVEWIDEGVLFLSKRIVMLQENVQAIEDVKDRYRRSILSRQMLQ